MNLHLRHIDGCSLPQLVQRGPSALQYQPRPPCKGGMRFAKPGSGPFVTVDRQVPDALSRPDVSAQTRIQVSDETSNCELRSPLLPVDGERQFLQTDRFFHRGSRRTK